MKGLKSLALSTLIALSPVSLNAVGYSPLNAPTYQTSSFTESVELNNILNANKKLSFENTIYSKFGVGISVISMIKQFLPYLNDPNFSIDRGFELKLAPKFSLEATCEPFTLIQLESNNQQPKIGIYFKFKLK